MMNTHVYDTDEKQIGFTLSYMTGGSALAFKENYIEGCILDGLTFFIAESFAMFIQKLKNIYEVGDIKATSMLHLANIKQGNRPLAEYSSIFDANETCWYTRRRAHGNFLQKGACNLFI